MYASLNATAPGLAPIAAVLSNVNQTGSWAAITQGPATPIILPVFLAYYNHSGVSAIAPGSYAYALLPGVPSFSVAQQAADSLRTSTTITNSESAQAVCQPLGGGYSGSVHQAVVWAPLAVVRSDHRPGLNCVVFSVNVGAFVIVIRNDTAGTVSVAVSNPIAERRPLTLELTLFNVTATGVACRAGPEPDTTLISLPLPTGARAGETTHSACIMKGHTGI